MSTSQNSDAVLTTVGIDIGKNSFHLVGLELDLQALHRVRSRLIRNRTAVINQIRAFLLERGIAVRQGYRHLRQALPDILRHGNGKPTIKGHRHHQVLQ